MPFYNAPSIIRIRVPAPGGEDPRSHPKEAHPPSVRAQVEDLVRNSFKTYREIGRRTGVNSGTISRWAQAEGWTRPRGAWKGRPRKDGLPAGATGRALARRIYQQCERLLVEVTGAPAVDPARLREALDLMREAREAVRERGRKPKRRAEEEAPSAEDAGLVPEARSDRPPAPEPARRPAANGGGDGSRPGLEPAPADPVPPAVAWHGWTDPLPSPHLSGTGPVWVHDRREAARQGWKRRQERGTAHAARDRDSYREAGLRGWRTRRRNQAILAGRSPDRE